MFVPCVRDVMSSPVVSIPRSAGLSLINRIMRERQIRHLPVVDAGRVVGMISLGDVRHAFPANGPILGVYELSDLLTRITAEDIVHTNLVTVAADAPITEAARLMLEHKIGGLPVIEASRLVGIITESDIFGAIAAEDVVLPETSDLAPLSAR